MGQIFLSWSGQKSHAVAKAFADWIPTVLLGAKPWISSADIEKGGTWITSIKDALNGSSGLGVFFATKDALASSWLLFEAGAIASLGHQRVCVVYVDVEASEVQPPLSLFQGTKLQKADLLALVQTLNRAMQDPMAESVLSVTFERGWSELDRQIQEALAASPRSSRGAGKKLGTDQVLMEIAESTQRIEARLSRLEEREASDRSDPNRLTLRQWAAKAATLKPKVLTPVTALRELSIAEEQLATLNYQINKLMENNEKSGAPGFSAEDHELLRDLLAKRSITQKMVEDLSRWLPSAEG